MADNFIQHENDRFIRNPDGTWTDRNTGTVLPANLNDPAWKKPLVDKEGYAVADNGMQYDPISGAARGTPEEKAIKEIAGRHSVWYNPFSWDAQNVANKMRTPFQDTSNPFLKLLNTGWGATGGSLLGSTLNYGGQYAKIKTAQTQEERDAALREGIKQGWIVAGKTGVALAGASKPVAGVKPPLFSTARFVAPRVLGVPGITAPLVAGVAVTGLEKIQRGVHGGESPAVTSVLPGRTPTPPTTSTSTGPGVLTPEQQQKVAEANKNRTDASGSSGPGGGRNYIDWRDLFLGRGLSQAEAERLAKSYAGMTTLQWTPEQRAELEKYRAKQAGGTTAGTGATTKPAAPGLLPLTPEQIWESGQEMTAAEKAYSDLLNEQKLQKAQAQREYTQQVQGLQRQAAGQAVDIAGQMAGSGLDISPAAAFGVEQTTQAPLVAGSQQARKSLDQYMADLVAAQKKAKAARDATIMNINSKKKMWQVSNTLASQRDAYGNLVR